VSEGSSKEGVESPAGPLKPVGREFKFACHPGVDCFGVCCHKLDLVLTPYDVLRLKRALGLTAAEFLEKHTTPADPERSRWPLIRLKMDQDREGGCPFLSQKGCAVYEDRPSACRTYPLARAAQKDGQGGVTEKFFKVEEAHCHGFREDDSWTIEAWVADQGLVQYHHWNDRWMAILTHPNGPGEGPPAQAKAGMFYLASYNLDRFLEFVSTPKFKSLFDLSPDFLERAAENQEELLGLALNWMGFSFFGEQTMKLREGFGR
jgi:uncharacterized protein